MPSPPDKADAAAGASGTRLSVACRLHCSVRPMLPAATNLRLQVAREAKVCDLERGVSRGLRQQQVLRLQVALHEEQKQQKV